ncbi:MAG: sugar phosphate isomerase/epimerase [Chloroflexi bacterium]|nr:sugar phosphate isomerase/epimerase [Chloroflexota bacterium]
MKISASYWMFEGGLDGAKPVDEAMREAKALGYDAIELCVASSGVLTDRTSEAECRVIAAEAKRIGIEIASVASGESWASSPTANDPAVRRRIIDFTARGLQVTRWLGTDAYLFVPGAVSVFFNPDAEVVPYDVCYQRAQEAVRQLAPVAERCQVRLGIENVWNMFLLSPLEMRDFIDSFRTPWVGAYLDVGNVIQFGYPEQWIRILGQRIARVHVKDFKRSIGTGDGFVDLLEGDVNFPAVRQALAEIGYDGYVTAEMMPWTPERPGRTAAALKKIFK